MFQNIAISASLSMTGAVTVDGTLNLENKYYYRIIIIKIIYKYNKHNIIQNEFL